MKAIIKLASLVGILIEDLPIKFREFQKQLATLGHIILQEQRNMQVVQAS